MRRLSQTVIFSLPLWWRGSLFLTSIYRSVLGSTWEGTGCFPGAEQVWMTRLLSVFPNNPLLFLWAVEEQSPSCPPLQSSCFCWTKGHLFPSPTPLQTHWPQSLEIPLQHSRGFLFFIFKWPFCHHNPWVTMVTDTNRNHYCLFTESYILCTDFSFYSVVLYYARLIKNNGKKNNMFVLYILS